MTNTKEKNQEHITQDQEHINQESEKIELYYDGITWVKYTIDYPNHQESLKKECTVIFPLDSNKWIWDYKMLKENKIISVDGEAYKINGFSWQCYDGIMKKNSYIQIQKI